MDKVFKQRITLLTAAVCAIVCLVFILDTMNQAKEVDPMIWAVFSICLGSMGLTVKSPFQ